VLVLKDKKISQHRKRSSLKFYTQCVNECYITLCKCHWIVLYTVHFTAFCLGGGAFFPGHGVQSSEHIHVISNTTVSEFSLQYSEFAT